MRTGTGRYQLVDAKFSLNNNLTNPNFNLHGTLTANQKIVYPWVRSGQSIVVRAHGANAIRMGLTPGMPITLEPSVHLYVNVPVTVSSPLRVEGVGLSELAEQIRALPSGDYIWLTALQLNGVGQCEADESPDSRRLDS